VYCQLPYIVNYSGIQEEVKELWYDQATNTTYAITEDRLCIIVPSEIKCKNLGTARNILSNNQTIDRFNEVPIFLGKYGELYEIADESIQLIPTKSDRYPNAAIYKDSDEMWIADFNIKRIRSNGDIDTIPIITNSEIPYWDIKKQNDQFIWFVNYGVGAYRLNRENNTIKRFSTLNGLPSNHLSCVHIAENEEIFMGFVGGLIHILNDGTINRISLKDHIKRQVVKEIESDGKGNVWFLTEKKLGIYNIATGNTHILPTNKVSDFSINTMEYNPTQEIMFFGTSMGLFISSSDGTFFNGEKLFTKGDMYYFGDELLISDNKQVQTYNLLTNRFEMSDHRPIDKVFPTGDGDNWITDSTHAILLDSEKKEVKKKIRLPLKNINQIRSVGNDVYFCYDHGIYKHNGKKNIPIIKESEPFYNVFKCGNKIFALSEHGLYFIENDEVNFENRIESNEDFLKSNKQFFIDKNTMLIPATRSILKLNCGNSNAEVEHFASLDSIYDFHIHDDYVYILTYDRVKQYKRDEYLKDPYSPHCIIPCNADENSSLFVDQDDKIWIRNYQGLACIDTDKDNICNIIPPKFDEELKPVKEPHKMALSIIDNGNIAPLTPINLTKIFGVLIILGILFIFLTFATRK